MKKLIRILIAITLIITAATYFYNLVSLTVTRFQINFLGDSFFSNLIDKARLSSTTAENFFTSTKDVAENLGLTISAILIVITSIIFIGFVILIILDYIFIRKFLENNTLGTNILSIITSFFIIYLSYFLMSSNVLNNHITNYFSANLVLSINSIILMIIYGLIILYLVVNLIIIFNNDLDKGNFRELSRTYVKPLFLIVIIICGFKLSFILVESYLAHSIINSISLVDNFSSQDILNSLTGASENSLLPQTIFDSQIYTTLESFLKQNDGIAQIISSLIDKYVLGYIHDLIHTFLINFVDQHLFANIYIYLLTFIIALIAFVSENITRTYFNIIYFVGAIIMIFAGFWLGGLIFTILSWLFIVAGVFLLVITVREYDLINVLQRRLDKNV